MNRRVYADPPDEDRCTYGRVRLRDERGVIETIIEPILLELRLIARTQKGRVALPAAVAHLHAHAERTRAQQLAVDPEPEVTS